jgi:ribonuclease HI
MAENRLLQKELGMFDPAIRSGIRRSRNFAKKLVQYKKRDWANAKLQNATSSEIWNFPNWSKGARNYPTPPIDRGEHQSRATTPEEKGDALRKELFQPLPELEGVPDPDMSSPHPDDLPFVEISEEEISDALLNTSNKSAPGPSQTSYQTIKWAWAHEKGKYLISHLIKKSLASGYHPKLWRKATAVALRKPNKPDYSKPRAYRLITLLECLGKLLEKIVARHLTFLAGDLNLVPPNQFGGRSSSSTSDAILTFTNDVQAAWNHDLVTSALTFDIKGYFDFVNHKRLIQVLREKHLPLEYVKWTANFLADREVAICVDGISGPMRPVENGIPQGSPTSPILAAFYTAELLELFSPPLQPSTFPHPEQATETNLLMYVDDGKLYVSSNSLDTNVTLLQSAYYKTTAWLQRAGLSPDTSKREIMHYSRRRAHNSSPSITLRDDDGETRTVTPTATVKWLGVLFDRKLRFEHHAKSLAARGENAVSSFTMLANTVRGLSHAHLRQLYISCVIPKILYACPAWWTGKQYQIRPLERVQRRALRLICAAFKTTPIHALELEASIPPIHVQAEIHIRRCAIRFNKLPVSSPIIQRLPKEWRQNQNPTLRPPPLPFRPPSLSKIILKKSTTLQDISSHTNPEHERIDPFLTPPWHQSLLSSFHNRFTLSTCNPNTDKQEATDLHRTFISNLSRTNNSLLVYTDGSLLKRSGFQQAGAATVGYRGNAEIFHLQMGLGGRAEIFDAEVAGLMMAANRATAYIHDHPSISSVHFFTDCSSALSAIHKPKAEAGQHYAATFCQTISRLLTEHPELKVNLAWCPSHSGIRGNERADTLAKSATALARNSPIGTTRTNALRRTKVHAVKMWKREWRKSALTGRFAIANRLPPSLKPTHHFTNLKGNRELFGRTLQCRTGHAYTGEFRQQFSLEGQYECSCGENTETREHILRDCPRYNLSRHLLEKASPDIVLPTILGTKTGISALSEFLRKSGAFSRSGGPAIPCIPPSFDDEPDPPDDDSDSDPDD